MKSKKRLIKISIMVIMLMVAIANLKVSHGVVGVLAGAIGGAGLVAVLSELIQVGAILIASGVNVIITAVTWGTGVAAQTISGEETVISGVRDIVFNQSKITTASFFENLSNGYPINDFAAKIGEYYVYIRNLAIALLLFILIYVGIRMAISTVAEQEAKYKKMLQNWAVSLALVFLLHYIIMITFVINDTLVNTLFNVVKGKEIAMGGAGAGGRFLRTLSLITGGLVPVAGWPEVIVYVMLTVSTVAFLIMYIKRVITLGFLIVISPLITVTYSIDKMGDGKSQALNTWLKEFVYSVLIQPFHCVIYIVFVQTSLETFYGVGDGLINSILAIASILFMLKAEGIIKKIFGLRADSMGDAMQTGAMAINMATTFFKGMKKNDDGKVPDMKGNKTKTTSEKVGNSPTKNDGGTNSEAGSADSGADSSAGNDQDNQETAGSEPDTPVQQGSGAADEPQNGETQPSLIQKALERAKGSAKNWGKKELDDLKQTVKHPVKTLMGPTGKFFERYSGEKGAKGMAKGMAKFTLKGGAIAFGAIAGAGLKDGGTAVSTAMAFSSGADAIIGHAEKNAKEDKAKTNQEIFAGAYNDFAEEYRRLHGEVSDEEISLAIEDLMDREKTEIKTDYERDMYKQAQLISETGEALGYKDGGAYLRDTIRKINNGEIETPEDYQQKKYDE